MKKTVNLTVRISEELKAEAEQACEYLDITLSHVVRKALRDVVKRYYTESAQDIGKAMRFMEGEAARVAHDALAREIEAKGGAVEVVLEGGKTTLKPADKSAYVQGTYKKNITPMVNEQGDIDSATMPRKLRRQYARDKAKGRV